MTRSVLVLLSVLAIAGCESGGLYGNSSSDKGYSASSY